MKKIRTRTVPEEMKQTLSRLQMRAKSGDEVALGELIRLLVPRIPEYELRDQTGMHDRDDIRSLKAIAVWKAVDRFDPGFGMSFESFAIQWMRYYTLDRVGWKRRNIPSMVSLESEEPREVQDVFVEPFVDGMDPRLLLIKHQFEQALMRAKPALLQMYELWCEKPWLSCPDMAEILGCSSGYVRICQQQMSELCWKVKETIMKQMKPFGVEVFA